MTERKTEQFTKWVEFKAADEDRQVATGVVMVPDKVDLQGDFAREATLRDFSEGFMAGLTNGDGEVAGGGVMHAVWPDDHVTLAENVILDESRTINGTDVPAGSWVQSWKFEDGELWSLVRDEILAGYSIGATEITWSDPMEQADLPDGVTVAADYPDGAPVWEIQGGKIGEVSSVDIPAVPDAEILALKADSAEKFRDLIGDKEQFVAEMLDRGHSQGDAERLWNYLRRAVDAEDLDLESSAGFFARAKRRLFGGEHAVTEKQSRTLSDANVRRLMAAHDSVEQALASELDFSTNRFTDNPTVDFSVESYDGKTASGADADGDTPDKTMSEDGEGEDPPAWAKSLTDQVEQNAERIGEIAEKLDGEKSEDGEDDPTDPEKALEDAPEWAKALAEQTEQNAEQIEQVAKASGTSQQLSGASTDPDANREYDKAWDRTFGLSTGGDA